MFGLYNIGDKIFYNIGNKIKGIAKVNLVIECIIFLIAGVNYSPIIFLAGIFIAWVSSSILYGFGEMVNNSQKKIRQNEMIIELLSNDDTEFDEIYTD